MLKPSMLNLMAATSYSKTARLACTDLCDKQRVVAFLTLI
jgi:hypothetical protein